MVKYTLYHIIGVKWGMTEDINRRLKEQGYCISDCCDFEYYDDVNVASNREKELNVLYGYKWNSTQDYRVIRKVAKKRIYKSLTQEQKDVRRNALIGKKRPKEVEEKLCKSRPRGVNVHTNKLKETEVLDIRRKYIPRVYSCYKLAKEYNVHFTVINKIISRKIWKHI